MAFEKFANLAETTLASGYTSGGTSISVASASDFPSTGVFRVRIGNTGKTIFRVDSVSGTTFTGAAEFNDANANSGDTVTAVLSAAGMGRLPIRLFSASADTSTVTTGNETLYSFTLPGGTLKADGDSLRIVVFFTFKTNGNNKSVVLDFGSTHVWGTGQAGFSNILGFVQCDIFRTGATAQKTMAQYFHQTPSTPSALGGANIIGSAPPGNASKTTPAETLSGDISILFRALTPTAGDVTALAMTVDYYPAA